MTDAPPSDWQLVRPKPGLLNRSGQPIELRWTSNPPPRPKIKITVDPEEYRPAPEPPSRPCIACEEVRAAWMFGIGAHQRFSVCLDCSGWLAHASWWTDLGSADVRIMSIAMAVIRRLEGKDVSRRRGRPSAPLPRHNPTGGK